MNQPLFFQKIISFLTNFFKLSHYQSTEGEVIGMAHFENQKYFFLKQNTDIFLVSDTQHRMYRKKITFPRELIPYLSTLRHCDGFSLDTRHYHMVCTVTVSEQHKTLYLHSYDGINFSALSLVENPDGTPTKIFQRSLDEPIYFFTSINGGIFYRILNLEDIDITYFPTGIFPRDNFFDYPPHSSFDHSALSLVGVFTVSEGVLLIYDSSYHLRGHSSYSLGGALLDFHNPSLIHWRTSHDEVPFWQHFQRHSEKKMILETLNAYKKNDHISVYFHDKDKGEIYHLSLHEPFSRKNIHPEKALLKKYINNPILKPKEENDWECHATFNSAAIQIDAVTHLLYRAEGSAGLSVLGYAESANGKYFKRYNNPVYLPRMDFEGVNISPEILKNKQTTNFKSGYHHYPQDKKYDWHGVEDPRITEIEGRLYMTYAAFNGYNYARPAITSIDKKDFLEQKWNWTIPQPMTSQVYQWSIGNKNVVLHPQKVDGKYLIYHRIWPHIRIDYVENLEFGPEKKYLKEVSRIEVRGDSWDSNRVGVSAPPLEIDEGWLLIYQASGSQDRRYKVGAMILDKDDPTKVLYRSNYPILVPDQWYEEGIAYVCGAVIRENILHIYYGGNDKCVCMASAPLREFIDKLKNDPYQKPLLEKEIIVKELCI